MRTFTYTPGNADEHKKLGEYLRTLPDGQNFVVVVKRNRPIRSLTQNRYYHLILNIIGLSTGHSHDELHEICKLKFNADMIHFPKSGSMVVPKSTTELDSKEFTAYINRVKQWAQDEFAIVIPEADSYTPETVMQIHNMYDESQSGM